VDTSHWLKICEVALRDWARSISGHSTRFVSSGREKQTGTEPCRVPHTAGNGYADSSSPRSYGASEKLGSTLDSLDAGHLSAAGFPFLTRNLWPNSGGFQ
jgi:hypothetical protein